MSLLLLALACTPRNTHDLTPDDRAPKPHPTEGADSGEADSAIPAPEVGCDALPVPPFDDQTLADARAYHALTFDDSEHLLGWDLSSAIMASDYEGGRSLFLPGLTYVEGMDRFPNGDIVFVDAMNGRIQRATPDGVVTTISNSTMGTYGVVVGPDQKLYTTDGGISRLDPETGELERLYMPRAGWSAHALNFSLDSTVMYVGTIGAGTVYAFALDEDLNLIGEPEIYAESAGYGWHDGLGIDVCGNLYLPDYSSSSLYRVRTDGTIEELIDRNSRKYGHGLQWGSGLGGWRSDALYLPQPYNGGTVREIVIGVASGDTVRTWKGEAVPW